MSYVDLPEIDNAEVSRYLRLIAQALEDAEPGLHTRFGVLRSLLLAPAARLHVARQQLATDLLNSVSYGALQRAAGPVDPATLAAIADNFGVTPSVASAARGEITVVVSRSSSIFIPEGAIFSAGATQFRTAQAYVVKTVAENVVIDAERALRRLADGSYAFEIDVVATVAGSAGNIVQGSAIQTALLIPGLTRIVAAGDFTGGADSDSAADLVTRIQDAVVIHSPDTRAGVRALIREEQHYPGVKAVSAVGFGDPEALRARRGVFAQTGQVDVYLRTASLAQTRSQDYVATVVGTQDTYALWEVVVSRDQLPGFWAVDNIRSTTLPEGGRLKVVSDQREVDLTGIVGESVPSTLAADDAVYSRYQTSRLRFYDTRMLASEYAVAATHTFSVRLLGLPLIANIQRLLSSPGVRSLAGETVARACVPCYVSVAVQLTHTRTTGLQTLATLANAVVETVNATNFESRLAVSSIVAALIPLLPPDIQVGQVNLTGRILGGDGEIHNLAGTSFLEIPYLPDRQISYRTVGFVCAPSRVTFSTVQVAAAS